MHKLELIDHRVPSLEMFDGVKELRVIAQSAGDRTQTPDVLRMSPSGVVASAIAVGDERRPH